MSRGPVRWWWALIYRNAEPAPHRPSPAGNRCRCWPTEVDQDVPVHSDRLDLVQPWRCPQLGASRVVSHAADRLLEGSRKPGPIDLRVKKTAYLRPPALVRLVIAQRQARLRQRHRLVSRWLRALRLSSRSCHAEDAVNAG